MLQLHRRGSSWSVWLDCPASRLTENGGHSGVAGGVLPHLNGSGTNHSQEQQLSWWLVAYNCLDGLAVDQVRIRAGRLEDSYRIGCS